MLKQQHCVGLLFDAFVRMMAALRFTRASTPLLAFIAVVVAGAALQAERFELARAEAEGSGPLALLDAHDLRVHGLGSFRLLPRALRPAEKAAPEPPVPVRRVPPLDAEQQNIARFIAKRYRIAIEQTQHFVEYAYRSAREFKVDPLLILAVISVESSFDPAAESGRGAQGLMQVHTRVHTEKFAPFGGAAAAFDPLANIKVGAQILKEYLAREGSVEGALKSYVGAALLPSDGGYGAKVLSERERIAAAAQGRTRVAGTGDATADGEVLAARAPASKDRNI